MISQIRGKIVDIYENSIVLEISGFGLEIFVPERILMQITKMGEELLLYTYFKVTEESMSLYGFYERKDLELFKKLIMVNGIGPKGALAMLSMYTSDELKLAILSEDAKSIAKVHGIGTKTAKRVILDLKDKVQDMESLDLVKGNQDVEVLESSFLEAKKEAISALIALGYSQVESKRAVNNVEIGENANSEQVLKLALKYLI